LKPTETATNDQLTFSINNKKRKRRQITIQNVTNKPEASGFENSSVIGSGKTVTITTTNKKTTYKHISGTKAKNEKEGTVTTTKTSTSGGSIF